MAKKGKISYKKVLNLVFWLIVCSFVVFLLPSISGKEKGVACGNIHINIQPEVELNFMEKEKVESILKEAMGGSAILGERKENLRTNKMEKLLRENPFVEEANVYTNLEGDLFVDLSQKIPIARVINKNRQSYYICKNGEKVPFSSDFTPRLVPITGAISESFEDSSYVSSERLESALEVINYVESNAFWRAQCEQLYVDKYGSINLIPKIGNHTIVVGSAEDIDEKFNKLMSFYKGGLSKVGWNNYRSIDLRFKDQVVGKKRKTE